MRTGEDETPDEPTKANAGTNADADTGADASAIGPRTPVPEPDGTAAEGAWRVLPERMRSVWIINEAVTCAITLAACAVSALVCIHKGWWDFWQPLVLGILAAWSVLSLAFQPVQTKYRYAFHRFRIGGRDLRIRTGWLWRKTTVIPFNRVQHVDTKQGPVLQHFGLTTVVVHTAAGEHGIESLPDAEAERVVEAITARVAVSKEDV